MFALARVIVCLACACVSVNNEALPLPSHRAVVTSQDLLAFTQQSPEDIYTLGK